MVRPPYECWLRPGWLKQVYVSLDTLMIQLICTLTDTTDILNELLIMVIMMQLIYLISYASTHRLISRTPRLDLAGPVYILHRGVQWKQGVVIYMTLCTSLLYNTTPIHCTPDPLHPPLQSIQGSGEQKVAKWWPKAVWWCSYPFKPCPFVLTWS